MRLVSTLLLLLAILGLSRSAVAQAPFWQWGLQSINPTTRDRSGATGCVVATGAGGQVYVGGPYGQGGAATRLFGGAGSVGPGAGGFVAQATAAGQWAWVRDVVPGNPAPGSSPTAAVTGVAAGMAGEVYATGFAYGTTLRVGLRQQPLGPNRNLFVARLSRTGACDWLLVADNPHQVVSNFLAGPAIATDPLTGGVVVSGVYQANLQLGSTLLPAPSGGGRVVCGPRGFEWGVAQRRRRDWNQRGDIGQTNRFLDRRAGCGGPPRPGGRGRKPQPRHVDLWHHDPVRAQRL